MLQNIIIRIPNWLGDAVMATAAVREFHKLNPDVQITLMGYPQLLSVYQSSPYINDFITYNRYGNHKSVKSQFSILQKLLKERYDAGYLLPNSFSSALWFWAGGVKARIGYRGHYRSRLLTQIVNPSENAQHQAQKYAYLLTNQIYSSLQPEIFLTETERMQAEETLIRYRCKDRLLIGMAPGAAYGSAKRWLPERFAETARSCISELDTQVLLFGNSRERDILQTVENQVGSGCINLAGQTGLRELFALVERCRLLITNDSGIMHVATALQTPVVALFGSTDPVDTGPLGIGHHIITKKLECAPCMKRECPLRHHACMEQIHVEEVIESVKSVWTNRMRRSPTNRNLL